MGQYDNVCDEELIMRMRSGEEGILDYLIEKYKGIVRKKARTMFLIGGETDDLIQEGMIGLFHAICDYRPDKEASFQTFARVCIERQIYSAIQNSNRQKHQPLNFYISLSKDNGPMEELLEQNPESIVIDQENTKRLFREIRDSLSSMENRVLKYYLDGYSYVQIGELMGRSTKSVDNAMRRIREKIRQRIECAGNGTIAQGGIKGIKKRVKP